MTTSVALCTYNGEKYIEEQLRSIIDQTHRVNEIVVCDDGSSDDTINEVKRISASTPDIDFKIFVNHPNLGVCANFDKAIHECSGDIIFLSDQDDVWMPNKVGKIINWFNSNPDKSVVFTNGEFIDSEGNSFTKNRIFESVGLNDRGLKHFRQGLDFELFLRANRATGATMAFLKSFTSEFTILRDAKIGNGLPLHDWVIALSAVSKGKLGLIEEPLIKYRIHKSQQVGSGNWIADTPIHLSNGLVPVVPKQALLSRGVVPESIQPRARFGEKRLGYRDSFLCYKVLSHIGEYHKYYGKMFAKIAGWDVVAGLIRKIHKEQQKNGE